MKIAIIGAHSTGKSTLIEKLLEKLQNEHIECDHMPELARLCPMPINENTTIEAQKWIQDNQIKQESEKTNPNKILICDRATIDNFAYLLRTTKSTENIEEYEQRAVKHMETYDFVFKTKKLEIEAEEDGKRTTNKEFRDEIDGLINELLNKHTIKYIELLPTTDYDDHLNFILEKIKERL